jgi:hypothetical protein
MPRWCVALFVVLLAAWALPVASAQNEPRYFTATGHYLRGAFRSFWERNGGLPILGYPLTEEYYRKTDGRIVQYFERASFELTIQGSQAIIGLGRLGVEVTGGKLFPRTPPAASTRLRRYFPETGHSLQGAFKTSWETRGGTAIFGLPISEEIAEQLADGRWHTVQYFERARFELWASSVLFGHLGRALVPAQLLERWPPNAPPAGPLAENGTPHPPPAAPPKPTPAPAPVGDPSRLGTVVHPILVPHGNGAIIPLAAPPGYTFSFTAGGFDPAERIGAWLTRPNGGGVEAIAAQLVAPDGRGNVRIVFGTAGQREGIWTITAQGATTGRNVTAPFKLTRDYVAPPGTPRPRSINGSVSPVSGGGATVFHLSGAGFRSRERLEFWITAPDGIYYLAAPTSADARGRIGYAPTLLVQFNAANPPGVYGYHYRGTQSGVRVDLYFTFTGAG